MDGWTWLCRPICWGGVGGADQRHLAIDRFRADPAVRQPFDGQSHRDTWRASSRLNVVGMTPAFQANGACEVVQRQAKFGTQSADVHAQGFAQSEHLGKCVVRTIRDDTARVRSHNASMARAPKSADHFDELRQTSGWYLAAWRSFKKLTLQELAVEMDTSRGQVSDLENGAINKRGIQTRYNRDWLELACKALNVAAGDLLDTNPFKSAPRFPADSAEVLSAWASIPDENRAQALAVLETFKRTGTNG